MGESREEKAYDHTSRVPGTLEEPTAETEHRDVAKGDSEHRNELTPDERGRPGFGPTTHDDTRFTRKDGADQS